MVAGRHGLGRAERRPGWAGVGRQSGPVPAYRNEFGPTTGEQPPMTSIPLVDLAAAHQEVAEEVEAGFKRVISETAFIGGAEVAAFEQEYAAFTGVPHCVGVANGTDALELALRAVGVGAGGQVIIPANT